MAAKEIKDRIKKVLDDIPEDILEYVIEYLKSLMNKTKQDISLSNNLKKILEEDRNLLERLAQ